MQDAMGSRASTITATSTWGHPVVQSVWARASLAWLQVNVCLTHTCLTCKWCWSDESDAFRSATDPLRAGGPRACVKLHEVDVCGCDHGTCTQALPCKPCGKSQRVSCERGALKARTAGV